MHVGVLQHNPNDAAYIIEILKTWGFFAVRPVRFRELERTDPKDTPVVVWPAGVAGEPAPGLAYARAGGCIVALQPGPDIAAAAGLTEVGGRHGGQHGGRDEGRHAGRHGGRHLRVNDMPFSGFAGERPPLPVHLTEYEAGPNTAVHAFLTDPQAYLPEHPAVTTTPVEGGSVTVFAFDPAACVRILRQGDPDRAGAVPAGDNCARASHLAAELGPHDAGWAPFADLIARMLVVAVESALPCPTPILHHLPGAADGLLLFSGDEDGYPKAHNEVEMEAVAAAGGRMNLYIFPEKTEITPADAARYRDRHGIGPHPNIRPLGLAPVAERVAEMERQIRVFEERSRVKAVSVRNHSFAWAGYMEPAEMLERLSVGMDVNFSSGTYLRTRGTSPYGSFGGAMPMRFCRPDGSLIDVFQQHTHLSDDATYSPAAEYSRRESPAQAAAAYDRVFDDMVNRFHTPYLVNFHPINWTKFSEPQGRAALAAAAVRGIPVWSVDQWHEFWRARDSRRLAIMEWAGARLRFRVDSAETPAAQSVFLPARHGELTLAAVTVNERAAALTETVRFRRPGSLVPLDGAGATSEVRATYDKEDR